MTRARVCGTSGPGQRAGSATRAQWPGRRDGSPQLPHRVKGPRQPGLGAGQLLPGLVAPKQGPDISGDGLVTVHRSTSVTATSWAAVMAITSRMIVISNSCSQHTRHPSHDLPAAAHAKSARLLDRQPDSGCSLPAGSADGAARHTNHGSRGPGPRSAHFRARGVSPSLPAPRFVE
jgi:hypothetical protein